MTIFALRLFLFSLLPVLFAAGQIWLDKSSSNRDRRLEVMLLYLFALGVAGSGIGGFIAHFFMADLIAESIGWATGSPFQLEIAFANLAIGALGILAVGRRDGTREAAVVAATIFSVGATIVHLMDIAATGNLAPGNTLQNFNNLIRPALLIVFLALSRRAERAPHSEVGQPSFERWRGPRDMAAGVLTGIVASGFGIGFAMGQPLVGSLLGIIAGAAAVYFILSRATLATAVE